METETRVQALQRVPGDCALSEGEAKMREIRAPSEGERRQLETKTRAQALQKATDDYTPSEGEQKTRRNHAPSEGGKRQLERETRAQALQKASGRLRTFGTPSEGVGKWQDSVTSSEGV